VSAALAGWLVALLVAAVAVRADRRRARLVAHALHEVRGPLTAARLAVATAERDRRPGALRTIDRELARAGDLLADLAAAPGGRRRPDATDAVDVAPLLRRAAAAWRPAAQGRGRDVLVVAPGAGLRVRGDRGRLLQALSNLLANAVEHGSGPVVVGARADGARLRLEVVDDGAQAAAPSPRPPGRGLGLAITADIARRHGGSLVREDGRAALELPRLEAAP